MKNTPKVAGKPKKPAVRKDSDNIYTWCGHYMCYACGDENCTIRKMEQK